MCEDDNVFLIAFVPGLISLFITSCSIYVSIKQLRKLEKLQKTIKYLYYLSSILSIITILGTIFLSTILCDRNNGYSFYIQILCMFCYFGLVLVILATLLFRSYSTFQSTIFRLSKCQILTFIILSILTMITSISAVGVFIYVQIKSSNGWDIAKRETLPGVYLGIITGGLYILTALHGMFVFSNKLLQITKLRATSMKNVVAIDKTNIKLNKIQTKLINSVSKYVSLLICAIFSSFLNFCVWAVCSQYMKKQSTTDIVLQIIFLCNAKDCMINMLCLYLQFPFSKKHYDKYCFCWAKFWYWVFTSKAQRSILKAFQKNIEMNSNDKNGKKDDYKNDDEKQDLKAKHKDDNDDDDSDTSHRYSDASLVDRMDVIIDSDLVSPNTI